MEIGRQTEKNAPCNADKHVFHFLGKTLSQPHTQIVIYCKPTKETKNVKNQMIGIRQGCQIKNL